MTLSLRERHEFSRRIWRSLNADKEVKMRDINVSLSGVDIDYTIAKQVGRPFK